MRNASQVSDEFTIPLEANYVAQGNGIPVILLHGMSASLHDWDSLLPQLAAAGFAGYALDLLGHGESHKPASNSYQTDWMFDHFMQWLDALKLNQPVVLIGHSLGGYIALEYASRFPENTQALILVDPFYSRSQLPAILRWKSSRSRM